MSDSRRVTAAAATEQTEKQQKILKPQPVEPRTEFDELAERPPLGAFGNRATPQEQAQLARSNRPAPQQQQALLRLGSQYGHRNVMRFVIQPRRPAQPEAAGAEGESEGELEAGSGPLTRAPAAAPPAPPDKNPPRSTLSLQALRGYDLPGAGSPTAHHQLGSGATLQTKLTVNAPDDAYEQEAEQVADAVMRMPAPPADGEEGEEPTTLQRKLAAVQRRVQRRAQGDETGEVSSEVEQRVNRLQGGGKPLPESDRSFFEERMGADFSGVRVHTDSSAAQTAGDLSARAFTVGNHIAFNAGEYQPGTEEGRRLLAHELTHVVQQGAAGTLRRKPAADEGVCPVCGKVGKGSCPGCGQPFIPLPRPSEGPEIQRQVEPSALVESPASETPAPTEAPAPMEAPVAPEGESASQLSPTPESQIVAPPAPPEAPAHPELPVAPEAPPSQAAAPQENGAAPPPAPMTPEAPAVSGAPMAPEGATAPGASQEEPVAPTPAPVQEGTTDPGAGSASEVPPARPAPEGADPAALAGLSLWEAWERTREQMIASQQGLSPAVENPTSGPVTPAELSDVQPPQMALPSNEGLQLPAPTTDAAPPPAPMAPPPLVEGQPAEPAPQSAPAAPPAAQPRPAAQERPTPATGRPEGMAQWKEKAGAGAARVKGGVQEMGTLLLGRAREALAGEKAPGAPALPEQAAGSEPAPAHSDLQERVGALPAAVAKAAPEAAREVAFRVSGGLGLIQRKVQPHIQRFSWGDLIPDWVEGALDALRGDASAQQGALRSDGNQQRGTLDGQSRQAGQELQAAQGEKGQELQGAQGEKEQELQGAQSEKEQELQGAQSEKEQELQAAQSEKEQELQAAQGEKEQELQAAQSEKEQELQAAQSEKEQELQVAQGQKQQELDTAATTKQQELQGEVQTREGELQGEIQARDSELQGEAQQESQQIETQYLAVEQESQQRESQIEQQVQTGTLAVEQDAQQASNLVETEYQTLQLEAEGTMQALDTESNDLCQSFQQEAEGLLNLADPYLEDLQGRWNDLKERAATAWNGFLDKAKPVTDAISQRWEQFSGWVQSDVWPAVQEKASQLADTVGQTVTNAREWAQGAWQSLQDLWVNAEARLQQKADATRAWIQQKTAALHEWVRGKADAARAWIQGKAEAARAWIGEKASAARAWIGEKANAARAWIGEKANAARAWIGEKADAARAWIGEKASAARSWISEKAAAAQSWIGEKASAARSWIQGKADALAGSFRERGHGLVSGLSQRAQQAVSSISSRGGPIGRWFGGIVSGLISGVERAGHGAVNLAGGALERGLGWLESKASSAISWVEQKASGAISWVSNAATGAINWVEEKGTRAVNWVEEKGTRVVTGLAGLATRVVTSVEGLATRGVTWVEQKATGAVNWVEQKATGAVNWVEQKATAAVNGVEGFLSGAIDRVASFGQRAVTWLEEKAQGVIRFAQGAWATIQRGWGVVKAGLGQALSWAGEKAGQIGSWLSENVIQPVGQWAGEQWGRLKGWVAENMPWLASCWEAFKSVAGTVYEKVQQIPIFGDWVYMNVEIWKGVLLGDLIEDPNGWNILGQVVTGFIPVVGQVADARDTVVALYRYANGEGSWGEVTLALGGFIPGLGDALKHGDKLDEALEALKPLASAIEEIPSSLVRSVMDNPALKEVLAKSPEFAGALARQGPDGMAAISRYGDDLLPFARHGDEGLDLVRRYGDEGVDLARRYGDEGINIVRKYGDDGMDAIRQHGDEAVDLLSRHGDEGLDMLRRGADDVAQEGAEQGARSGLARIGERMTSFGGWVRDKAVAGAGWARDKVVAGAEWVRDTAKTAIYHRDFADLNATQYRIRTDGVIEAVQRRVNAEGKPEYWVTGIVERFEGSRPVITPRPPESLGDWAPRVSHINGIMVKPEGGIGSAQKLQEAISTHLAKDGEVGLTPDLLYTYSSTRGFARDMVDALSGKLYIDDMATDEQTTLMLDAVRNKRRTTVSAHSRGTIKTDNAVRNTHRALTHEFIDAAQHHEEVQKAAEEAAQLYELHADQMIGIDRDMYVEIVRREKARQIAGQMASEEMNEYIQLIYAGNAVQFPSNKLEGDMVVGHLDPVSMLVGTYADFATPDHMTMHRIRGGHGFDENYVDTVGKLTAEDILKEQAGKP